MSWLDGITDSMDELQEMGGLAFCSSWGGKDSYMT